MHQAPKRSISLLRVSWTKISNNCYLGKQCNYAQTPPEKLIKIFFEFNQVDESNCNQYGLGNKKIKIEIEIIRIAPSLKRKRASFYIYLGIISKMYSKVKIKSHRVLFYSIFCNFNSSSYIYIYIYREK